MRRLLRCERIKEKRGGAVHFRMCPKGKTLRKKIRNDFQVTKITLLGGQIEHWERTSDEMVITLRDEPADDLPACFKIEL